MIDNIQRRSQIATRMGSEWVSVGCWPFLPWSC